MMDLDEAEEQYNMGFRAEVDMMTEMMDIHGARFEYIFLNFIKFAKVLLPTFFSFLSFTDIHYTYTLEI